MLSLRSIWRGADLVQEPQLGGTREILHGLKATQDDARGGGWNCAMIEGRGLTSEV